MLANAVRRLGFSEVEQPARVVFLGGFFVAFAVLDRLTRAVGQLGDDGADSPVLIAGALGSNPLVLIVVIAIVGALVGLRRARLWCRWTDLEQGETLRLLIVLSRRLGLTARYRYNNDERP